MQITEREDLKRKAYNSRRERVERQVSGVTLRKWGILSLL